MSRPEPNLLYGYPFTMAVAAILLAGAVAGRVRACELPVSATHSVTGVSDARTLKLGDGSELRLAAILAPTAYDSPAGVRLWPAETAAAEALKVLTNRTNIGLSLAHEALDRYGRRLGHALITSGNKSEKSIDERWVEARLVRMGHARVVPGPDMDAACVRRLLTLEAEAESGRRGLWAEALYHPKRAEDRRRLLELRSTYQIVEGVVSRVSITRSTFYLNFGDDWRRDFTASFGRSASKTGKISASSVRKLARKAVRVRGWLEKRNGPMIRIWRADQIELLAVQSNGKTVRKEPPELLGDPQE